MIERPVRACFLALWLASLPAAAQQPAAPAPASPLPSNETATQIRNLKFQAIEATQANKPDRARQLYLEVLKLDPDDFLARQELKKLDDDAAKKKAEAANEVVKAADDQAKVRALRERLSAAENLVFEVRAGGAAKLLDEAQQHLDAIRKADPKFEGIDRVQALLDAERSTQRTRFWTLVGFGVLAALVIIVPTVLYFWRGKRVMEMLDGPMPGQVFALKKEATRIGALAAECDVTISDPLRKISRRHCDIIRHGRHYFIVDYSTNGTQLNGQPLTKGEPVLLRRGDRVALSPEVVLQFR